MRIRKKKTFFRPAPVFYIVIVISVLLLSGACSSGQQAVPASEWPMFKALNDAKKLSNNSMKLSSSAFANMGNIPSEFTCDGANISPPLAVSGVSGRARSLVLIVDDPDAPKGGWVHWTAWNIPVKTSEIPAGGPLPPEASEGMTDFGKPGWGGPCPPSGAHRYFFRLYAVGSELYLDASASKKEILEAIEGMVIEQAELIGIYERSEK